MPDLDPKPQPADLVEPWFVEFFHGLGGRLEDELYNHFYKAKEELKARLSGLK